MKNIYRFIIIGFLSLIGFELFLKFSPFSYGITPMTYDKDIGMWHKKNFSNYIIQSCYKTKYFFDQEGRLKNNYQYNDNKKNIIIIGDSNVEALMVKSENIIHNSLYDEIDGKYNVLNYGLSGTGPTQHLEIINKKIDLTKVIHLIHFVFIENDLSDGNPKNFDGTNRPKVHLKFKDLDNYELINPQKYNIKEKLRDFLGNFEIYVYLKKAFIYYKRKINSYKNNDNKSNITESDNSSEISDEEYEWNQLKGSVYQINKISKKNNFQYDVVFLSESEDKGNINFTQKFKEFLDTQNINNINILTFLNELKTKQKLNFECDSHWNDNVHRNVARYLNEELDI